MFFIRTATPSDVSAIHDLLATTWRDTYIKFYGADKVEGIIASWHSPASIQRNMTKPNGEYLVADDGKQIGGMAFASMTDKIISLHQIYIHPHLQRQGIGQMLFAEIETCFMDANAIALEVEPENANAIAFYERHGFVNANSVANCGTPDSGIPALKMSKSLKS